MGDFPLSSFVFQLSALPASTSIENVSAPVPTPEPALVGAAATGASIAEPAGSLHPAYAGKY